ncbi:MAG: proline iminopeptidase-family hydrolase [Bacteroidetes bacterium]|nr:proline iminopeptidase-family hydrolase [Bacteroidota bacterium]
MGAEDQILEGQYVAVHGGNIWYKVVGAEKQGVPLIVIHGGPGASHDYLLPLEKLADSRPVVFYDQLGCGFSERPDVPALWEAGRFVRELRQLIVHLGFREFVLLGQSWGTTIAAMFAFRKQLPGLKAMVLSAPMLQAQWWIDDQRKLLEMMPPQLVQEVERAEKHGDFETQAYQDAMTAFYRKHLCRLETWPDCLQSTFAKMNNKLYNHMWGPSEFTVRGTLFSLDLSLKVEAIEVPVLYTCGEFDEATPQTCRYYQLHTPGAALKVFNGASHMHHLESPEEYIDTVNEFMIKYLK